MFTLLSWLYDQAGRVYFFFGYLYTRIRDAALNAYDWARQAASDAYTWARSNTLYYYNLAKYRIAAAIQTAWNTTIQYYGYAINWIENVRNYLIGQILYYYNRAVDAAQLIVQGTQALIDWAVARVKSGLENLIYYTGKAAEWARGQLSDFINARIDQAETNLENLKATIGADTNEGIQNLVTIFSNPVGWIYALLLDRFTDFLCYQLAKGLGTVKYELPPAPNFAGSGGGVYPGAVIPTGASGLVPPLDTLYVSGYTFNNPPGHMAVDFGLQNGDPVYAMHDGVVQVDGWSTVGYGFQVVIQGDEWWSRYAHCRTEMVSVGDRIRAGRVIGLGDSTGNSTGPHLHLELKRLGQWIDPLSVL